VILAESDAEPPGPVAVAMYVTDEFGDTERFPVVETSPMPGSIRTLPAFVVSHCNATAVPRSTVAGVARNVIVG
jgi:hypothetical protein